MNSSAERAPSPDRRSIFKNSRGMTLIEVVVILLVLGVLAFTATTRMTNGTTELQTTTEGVSSHLRLVQTIAINSSPGVWGLRFETTDNTYYMFHCTDPNNCDMDSEDNIIALPGVTDENKRFAVSDGNIMLLADGNVAYDDFGRPYAVTDNQAALSDENIIISFQDGDGNTDEIQITPETGFIP